MKSRRIIVAVTGSIAAYKACELIRLLTKQGAEVKVILTDNAQQFVHKNTFDALTNNQAHCDTFEDPMLHIELAKWADSIVIAPATASIISQLAQGMAGDLLTTVCLASKAKLFAAPAMNTVMWKNPATQANVKKLQEYGYHFIMPDYGIQACGDIGYGRMVEPENIAEVLLDSQQLLKELRIVITAGPTQEKIDPVRYLSNYSSGKMGYALAYACQQQGAKVTLISGPTNLIPPTNCNFVAVNTANDMLQAVSQAVMDCDIFISAAAVADYTPKTPAINKIKKSSNMLTIELVKTPDILATIAAKHPELFKVGFCAETENLIENARKKLIEKSLQVIIANQVSENGYPFGSDNNAVTLLTPDGTNQTFTDLPKTLLAMKLIELLAENYQKNSIKNPELGKVTVEAG